MLETLRDLVVAEKQIVENKEWSPAGRSLEIKLPLFAGEFAPEGFFFRATAIAALPDEQVTFQLEYHGVEIPGGTGPLCRLEWRPKSTHNNKGKGPADLRFIEQVGTHFHSFEENWSDKNGALLRGNLPVARPIAQDIQDFRDCLALVGNLFGINNILVVKTPEWVLERALWD